MRNFTSKKLKIITLLAILLSSLASLAQTTVPFTQRRTMKVKGDVMFVGNHILNRVTTNPTRTANTAMTDSGNNNDMTMEYIDIDSDATTFSSSSANLAYPVSANSCYRVAYAGLYWASIYPFERSNNSADFTPGTGTGDNVRHSDFNQAKIKFPLTGAYQNLTADQTIFDGFGYNNGNYNGQLASSFKDCPIVCYKDITTLMQGLTTVEGTYTVANIRAAKGKRNGGCSAGWVIVVIYENVSPNTPSKFISIFDGYSGVQGNNTATININGFTTLPAPFQVNANLGVGALEGDLGNTGDGLSFKSLLPVAGPETALSTANNNPANNFFNSTITNNNAIVLTRNPASTNTLGFDLDMLPIPNPTVNGVKNTVIPNGTTGAQLKLSTAGDGYGAFLATFSVEIIEPNIYLTKRVLDAGGNDIAGQNVTMNQELTYEITYKNVGNDSAQNLVIRDQLPTNTTFTGIANVVKPTWVTLDTSVPGTIRFINTDNSKIVKNGTGGTTTIRFKVRVASNCNELTDHCSNIIQNQAYATYQGIDNTNTITEDPSVSSFTCGAVPGPTNSLVGVTNCVYARTEILCSPTITLTAGDGYASYSWVKLDPAGNIPMGNTQSIVVSVPGQYKVTTTSNTPPCIGIDELITVNLSANLPANPLISFADNTAICANQGVVMSNIFLCGLHDQRVLNVGNVAGTATWYKLNTALCNTPLPANCPHNGCPESNWASMGTGPSYTVTDKGEYRLVINNNGCQAVYYFNVTKNDADPQIAKKDILCGDPGEIKVINLGSGYEYRLVDQTTGTQLVPAPSGSTPTYGSVSTFPINTTGTYTVQIRQVGVPNPCIFTLNNIGIQNAILTSTLTTVDKTCNTLAPASIIIEPSGFQFVTPAQQYMYQISGPITLTSGGYVSTNPYTFNNNLAAGTYVVTVTSTSGCTSTNNVTIHDYSRPTAVASVQKSISCDPGVIQITASGGVAPYTFTAYSKDGVVITPTPAYFSDGLYSVANTEAGTYVFLVQDNNGCETYSNPITISNIVPVITSSFANPTCSTGNNGSITISATGTGITYELTSGGTSIVTNATGSFPNLAAGTYIVNVIQTTSEENICTYPRTFTLTAPTAITAAASVTTPYTCLNTGATITVTSVSGGTGAYQYSINGTTFGASNTFNNVTAGTYTVTVRDANGCTFTTSSMTITAPVPVTNFTINSTAVTCSATTSTVTLSAVVGGAAPFNYAITAPAGSAVNNGTSTTFAGLAPGTYTFTVTDSKGCTYSKDHTIATPTPIAVVGAKVNDVRCFGTATGAITYTVTGFATNYNYTVANSAGATTVAGATAVTSGTVNLTNLLPGTYTIMVTNPTNSCTATAAVTIANPTAALTVTNTPVQPTCTVTTGSVTVNATGGWGSNSYELAGPTPRVAQSSNSFTGLAAGNYTITVTDANGCPEISTFTLTAPVVPVLTVAGSDVCLPGTSITVAVTAGTGLAPFQFSLNGGAYAAGTVATGTTYTNLPVGTHTITVRDANGCTNATTITRTINAQLTASTSLLKGITCTAPAAAQIEVTIVGGASPYQYQVSYNGGTFSALTTTATPFTYPAATVGTYEFRITDAAGCTFTTPARTVAPLVLPEFAFGTITNVLCNGASTGALPVNIDNTKGLAPYTIAVTNTTTSASFGTQTSGLPAGNYSVVVTDANGCSVTHTTTITQPNAIAYVVHPFSLACSGNISDPITPGRIVIGDLGTGVGVTGGTAPYTYNVTNNFGDILTPYITTQTAVPNMGEAYEFQIINYGIYTVNVVDANGCSLIETNIVIASPPESLTITTSGTADCTTGLGSMTVQVGAAVSGPLDYQFAVLTQNTPPYVANPGSDFIGPNVAGGTVATFNNLVPGLVYTFVVYDPNTYCYFIKQSTVAVPTNSTIAVARTPHNITCADQTDGSVSLTVTGYSGTTSQLSYTIYESPSITPTAFTGTVSTTGTSTVIPNIGMLDVGNYIVLVREVDGPVAGCGNASSEFTITKATTLLQVTAAEARKDDCNPNAGIITATAQFGAGNYRYLLLPDPSPAPVAADFASAPANSTGIFNAEAGFYIVFAMDAYGCIKSDAIELTGFEDPAITAVITPSTQCAATEGTFSIDVTRTAGDAGGYTYSLNGGAFEAQADTFTYTGLSSGTYTITIKDGNGCTYDLPVADEITIYPPLTATAQPTVQPACADNDGVIVAEGDGGSGNYEYLLAGPVTAVAQPSPSFTGLPHGTYTVTIRDTTTGCDETVTVTLEDAIEIAPADVTIDHENVSCNGNTDGSITITLNTVTNTDIPYTYEIDGPGGIVSQSTPVFTGLAAGTYDVTVTSGKNCTYTTQITITQPAILDSSASITTAFSCAQPANTATTAVVTVVAAVGTGTSPYTYSIDGSNYTTTNTFAVANPTAQYNLTTYVKDDNGCIDTFVLSIDPMPALTSASAAVITTAIDCNTNGVITVTAVGGSGNFIFRREPATVPADTVDTLPGDYDQTFTITGPGVYTYTITDEGTGCYMTVTAPEVLPYDIIDVTATASTPVDCFGSPTGTLTIDVQDYTGPYTYTVFDGATSIVTAAGNTSTNPLTITALPAGNLFVRVEALNTPFCDADSNSITIGSPASALTPNATMTANVTCTNDKGEITANATGGWGTYEYEFINVTVPATPVTIQAYGTNNVISNLTAGNYTISVRDSSGCIATQTITLAIPPIITATVTPSTTAVQCYGDDTASITVSAVSGGQGTGNYQYVLNTYDATGTTIVSSTGAQTSPVFANLGAGIYSVTVIDGWGCDSLPAPTTPITITQPTPLLPTLSLTTGLTCLTQATLTIAATGGTATPAYQYSTNNGATYIPFPPGGTLTVGAGNYQYLVRDANGCAAEYTNDVDVLAVPALNVDLTITEVSCHDDTNAQIYALATGALGNYQYTLLDADNSYAVLAGPSADGTFAGLGAGNYAVRVQSSDCIITSPDQLIDNPAALTATPVFNHILCYGDPTGSITINTTGGTGNVQFAIAPLLNQFFDDNVFDNLRAGSYDILVQDANGCFILLEDLIITEPTEIRANIVNVTDVTCAGESDGTIRVTVSGGTGTYAISTDNINFDPFDPATPNEYTLTGLGVGTTTVYVKDQNGCSLDPPMDQPILPGVNLAPVASVVTSCVANAPSNTVTIATTLSANAIGTLEYSLDNATWQLSNVFTVVSAVDATYTAYVRHTMPVTNLQCTQTDTFNITGHTPIAATADITQTIDCYGDTGEITINVTAGAGTAPFEYAIGPLFTYDTPNAFSGLITGTYNFKVRDALGCEIDITGVLLDQPTLAVSVTTAYTDDICLGDNDGTITVTPAGGTPDYTVSIDGGTTFTPAGAGPFVFNNLAPDTYQIVVRDANNCAPPTAPADIVIAPGLDIEPTADIQPTCVNNVIGNNVFIIDDNGNANLQYSLDGGAYDSVGFYQNIAAGSHTATIMGDNGCIQTRNFTVPLLTPITASVTATTDVNCFGDATGNITVTATGGTGTLSYAIADADVLPLVFDTDQATGVFNGLIAGNYVVKIVDDNVGCETQVTATITEPTAPLTATAGAQTDVLCYGNATGSATVNVTGGTVAYTYSWDTTPIQTTATATGLTAGTYTVTVTDANSCTTTQSFTITQPTAALAATAGPQTNVLCFGNATGSATVNVTGGTVAYTYSWDTTPVQTTATATGLTAGTYTVTVTDANGCTTTQSFTITQPAAALVATAGPQTDVLCYGNATGAATVNVTGGTVAYTYSWDTTPVQTTATATGLTAGTYTVTVTDANGCTATQSFTITQPAAPLAATAGAQTNVLCFGNATGAATVNVTGGTVAYTYSWNTTPVQTAATATGLTAGTYTVTVTDANGCTTTQSFTITQPAAPLSATIGGTQTNVLCFGNATGSATVNATGGTGAYTYSWDTTPVQTTATATGLTAGTYTVTVTDANSCTTTQSFTITQPAAALVATAGAQTNVLCFGNATGSATVNVTGGTTAYSYSWNTTPVQTTATATGLTAGTYTVTVTDANGCTATQSFTITQPAAALVATAGAQTNILCFGNATGSATVNVTGGTGAYTYSWNTTPVQTTATATGLTAGTYTVTVTDANGCTTIQSFTITQPAAALVATAGAQTNILCFGNATGSATVNVTGGTGAYTYSWNTTPVQTTATATGLTAGTYTVTVTDANGCTTTQSFTITQPAAPLSATTGGTQTNVLCFGGSTGSATVNATGGTVPYTYSWNTTPVQTTATATGLTAGTYTVTVTDANGCTATQSFTITQPATALTATAGTQTNVLCFAAATGSATIVATGGTGTYTYSWNTTPVQTTATATGLTAGTYTVTVTDANGCTATQSFTITQPATAVTATTTHTDEQCLGDNNGSVTVTPQGGTAPYTASINGGAATLPSPAGTPILFSGLGGGNYTIVVTDANGCTVSSTTTVLTGIVINASVSTTQVCTEATIVVSVNAAVAGQVTYSLDGGTPQASNTFANVVLNPAVPHSVTVTHTQGCSQTVPFTIAPVVPINLTAANVTVTNIACHGQDVGSITVNATGGTGPLQYAITWDIWPTAFYGPSNTFNELLAGDYVVHVKDAMGCVQSLPVTITEPADQLVIAAAVGQHESCVNAHDGAIDITSITGGTAPYYVALDSPANFQPYNPAAAPDFAGLYGRTLPYDVYVRDANGCYAKVQVIIEKGVNLVPNIQTVLSCVNNAPVNTVTATLNANINNVEYRLVTSTGTLIQDFAPNHTWELAPGSYVYTVRHINGCQKDFAFTVQPRVPITVTSVTPVDATCNGNADGTLTVVATGGTGALSYGISPDYVMTNNPVFTGLVAGTYTIRVQDQYGCYVDYTNFPAIGEPAAITVTDVMNLPENCVDDNDGAFEIAIAGGNAPYATSLDANGPFVADQTLFDNLDSGTYTVYVQDANGCTTTHEVILVSPLDINATAEVVYNCDQNTVTIVTNSAINPVELNYAIISGPKDGNSPPQASNVFSNLEDGSYEVEVVNTVTGCTDIVPFTITSVPDLALSATESGLNQVKATVVGGEGPYQFTFNGDSMGTKNTFVYFASGTYEITVTDSRGCTRVISITVEFIDVILPDVVSPDGDGQNDTWSPGNATNYPKITSEIFDRYGRKLATLKQGDVWDGTYDGSPMPTGDYWYLVKLNDADDRSFVGHFTIYR